MYRYKYNTSYHHKSRRARRSTVLAAALLIVTVGAAAYIAIDTFIQSTKKQDVTSQPTYSSVQGASINLFRTEYFQFQADNNWKEIPTETTNGHYVYRSFKGPLVEHDIIIDVNSTKKEALSNVRTNHVMPVEIDSTGKLNVVNGAGDHCKTAVPKDVQKTVPLMVTQRQVTFACSPDSVLYEVKLGVVGGTTDMLIPRPDGTSAKYVVTYRNLKFTPDDSVLRNIVDTFQTR